jgi:hypothetical protein
MAKFTPVEVVRLMSRSLGGRDADIRAKASRVWEISPAEKGVIPAAHFLPGQLDRISGTAFVRENFRHELMGGRPVLHEATRAYLIEDAWLIDGRLYKGRHSSFLHPRLKRGPTVWATEEFERGAICCSAAGNRYFGQWLLDDLALYVLAETEGVPVCTAQPRSSHLASYEEWSERRPRRVEAAHFRQLVLFDDQGQNTHKHARFRNLVERLNRHVVAHEHPGVFLLRGLDGERRQLVNEIEIAELLASRYGFTVIDPLKTNLSGIAQACAGARVVAGVEGSQLAHGMMFLNRGGAMLVLEPPNRFGTVFKDVADREAIHWGFVVGLPVGAGFRVDIDEVERTLALLSRAACADAGGARVD